MTAHQTVPETDTVRISRHDNGSVRPAIAYVKLQRKELLCTVARPDSFGCDVF